MEFALTSRCLSLAGLEIGVFASAMPCGRHQAAPLPTTPKQGEALTALERSVPRPEFRQLLALQRHRAATLPSIFRDVRDAAREKVLQRVPKRPAQSVDLLDLEELFLRVAAVAASDSKRVAERAPVLRRRRPRGPLPTRS